MWGHKTSDTPLTINPVVFNGGVWVAPDGTQHPRGVFRDASWRSLNNIVELVEPVYDARYNNASAPLGTYTPLGGARYEIDRTITQKPLAQLQAIRVAEVNERRKAVLYSGVTSQTKPVSTTPEDLHTFHLMALTVLQGNRVYPPSGVKVYTMTGERVAMNETQFKQLVDDLALHFFNTDNNADTHIAALEALGTQQQVIDYDITTGWPANPVIGA